MRTTTAAIVIAVLLCAGLASGQHQQQQRPGRDRDRGRNAPVREEPPGREQVRPKGLASYEGRYYVIHSDLSRDELREAELRMSRMAEEYHARTKDFAGAIRTKFPFYLFENERDYHAAGGAEGSAGMFNPNRPPRLMAWTGGETGPRFWHTVQHEGFHQFADAVIGGDLPIWVNEGLAEYFGEGLFTGDSFVTGVIPQWRLERVRKTFAADAFMPVRDMMILSHEQWNQGMSTENYDQAWAMVHFLVHADDGKYRDALASFIRAISRGQRWDRAWQGSFGSADGFEEKWKGYWTKLPDNPTTAEYEETVVRTLASLLARAAGERAIPRDVGALLAATIEGKLVGLDDKDWLPPSLGEMCKGLMEQMGDGYRWEIAAPAPPPARPPQILMTRPDGTQLAGKFAKRGGKIEVTVEPVKSPAATKPARPR